MSRPHPIVCLITLAAALVTACGSDDDGGGPPALHGAVSAATPGAADALLLWFNSSTSPDRAGLGARAPVDASAGRAFQIDLEGAPDASWLNDYTDGGASPEEARVGVAFITAVPTGFASVDQDPPWLGVSERHLLVYLEEDVAPGSMVERLVGGELPAGYHLMDVIDVDDPGCDDDTFDCLRESADGLGADIEVRFTGDPESLDWPDWT
jgi:hypothetical protein